MKARRLICPAIRRIEVEDFETGPVPDDGILVENDYTLVSVGTEIYNWVHGNRPGVKPVFPRITGYCSTGTVLEVGKNVQAVKPGDRIAGTGHHASHAVITKSCQKVPDNVSPKSAVFTVMAHIALHGIRVARIDLGESVAVLGLGLVGQFAASLAKLDGGLPVIAIDLDDFRLERAKARGADACINPREVEDVPAAVRELCTDDGANVVMESTGKPAVYPMAVKLACVAGRMVALGSPRGTVEFNFMDEVHLREVSILGAIQPKTPVEDHIYYHWTRDRDRYLLLRLMSEGRLTVEDLITHIVKPEQCQEIYTMLADRPQNVLGVLFDWH